MKVGVKLKYVSDDIAFKCVRHKLLFRDLPVAILVHCFHHLTTIMPNCADQLTILMIKNIQILLTLFYQF